MNPNNVCHIKDIHIIIISRRFRLQNQSIYNQSDIPRIKNFIRGQNPNFAAANIYIETAEKLIKLIETHQSILISDTYPI